MFLIFHYKEILGAVAVALGFIGYLPYIRDTLAGKTKPHMFSWFLWGTLETIGFFAQILNGGGAGSWAIGMSAIICYFIAALALSKKYKQITTVDCIAFAGAIVGIIVWKITDNALFAIICVSLADAFAFIPTFRKSYSKPFEETLTEYFLSATKLIITLPALGLFTMVNWLYPVSLIYTNTAFVVMVLIRRKTLTKYSS